MTINVALAGAGAFGIKHLDAIKLIEGVKVISLVGRELAKTEEVARKYGIAARHHRPRRQLEDEGRRRRHPVHADADARVAGARLPRGRQTRAGRDPAVRQARRRAGRSSPPPQASGKVAMCGHTRRFNPSHQWVRQRIVKGELTIQHMNVQTYFFRRTNMNALGQPRSWTDHLLWHHAAHTVDLFAYQTRSPIVKANAIQGPIHPTLGIAMDMSIQLEAASGAICTLSLSFNNDGPLGTFFRYIGDTRHLHRALRRPVQRQGREDRRVEGRRVDERHRAAGPRVLRRDPRRPRAQRQRRAGAALLPGAAPARATAGLKTDFRVVAA